LRLAKQAEEDLLADMTDVLGEDPRRGVLCSLAKSEGDGSLSEIFAKIIAQMPQDCSASSDSHLEKAMITSETCDSIRIVALHPTLKAHVRRSAAFANKTKSSG
jgi:hypothetical protein